MASDLSPLTCNPNEDELTDAERALIVEGALVEERVEGLFRRAFAFELPLKELAPQVFSVIQERVALASAQQNPDESKTTSTHNDTPLDTPGLETMGWALWKTVNKFAREDQSHHYALIAFINAFFQLLYTQPWTLWGSAIQDSNFLLGPMFRESLQPVEPTEQGINGWINFCRFVAIMTRDTEQDFSLYLLWFARDALEDCTWCPADNPDASVLAFEGVVDVCAVQMFRSEEDFGRAGSGGDGVRKWDGKLGFCKERWLFWENGLRNIARDQARPVEVRDSAQRTAAKMKSIREETKSS